MTLDELIELAREYRMSDAEKREQLISFAYGNTKLHNPDITREIVESQVQKLATWMPEPEPGGARVDRYPIPGGGLNPHYDAINAQIRKAAADAILEERERCAKIAEQQAAECGDCYYCSVNHSKNIAEIIRSGK